MVGLCPWTAKKGDVVVLLDGSRVPFLVRLVQETASRDGADSADFPRYEFVGECFLIGIMDGSYYEAQVKQDRPRETLVLI